MLLWTLIAHSNYVFQYITISTLFSPRYYPLTPFTPVQPNLPSKVVTYVDNYRCVANILDSSLYNANFYQVYVARYKN